MFELSFEIWIGVDRLGRKRYKDKVFLVCIKLRFINIVCVGNFMRLSLKY